MCTFFFFKQKTAYEMRISDWSSDVCSSDLQFQQGNAGSRRQVAPGLEQSLLDWTLDQFGKRRWNIVPVGRQCHFAPAGCQPLVGDKIGRASCRERVCQYV